MEYLTCSTLKHTIGCDESLVSKRPIQQIIIQLLLLSMALPQLRKCCPKKHEIHLLDGNLTDPGSSKQPSKQRRVESQ
ncbi:unnamed protein product [Schistosoma mattheei]|uniref:Uncharacterized protein n=1 Tax=Schistosoma mattheei TaxID=31246 RepID=A0A183P9Q7_9TREM|nr:unnamed protein product [Schistosoma mattheei]